MRILHSRRLVLISKPRSGSTSLRRALDEYLRNGDIACDMRQDLWHPHDTARRLKRVFAEQGWDFDNYVKVSTSRNPFDLVVSYYNFFRPDIRGKYNFQPRHDADNPMPFRQWVMEGRIWDQTTRQAGNDLGTISIDNYCYDADGTRLVEHIFDLNDRPAIEKTLRELLGDDDFALPHVNQSQKDKADYRRAFDAAMQERVRAMFPKEFELFDYEY